MSQPGRQYLSCTGIIINKHLSTNHVFEISRWLVNFIIYLSQRGLIQLCTFGTFGGIGELLHLCTLGKIPPSCRIRYYRDIKSYCVT